MSEAQKDDDQSMDDILASIRKIISNDGTPSSLPDGANGDGQAAPIADQVEAEVAQRLVGRGPLDDLSDIFEEPAGGVNANAVGVGLQGTAGSGVTDQQAATWPFDGADAEQPKPAGSLTDKLASLGGATNEPQPAGTEIKSASAPVIHTSDDGLKVQGVVEPRNPDSPGMSLEDTLENVRKAAAVAAVPEASPIEIVAPSIASDPVVKLEQNEPIGVAVSETPTAEAVGAGKVEPVSTVVSSIEDSTTKAVASVVPVAAVAALGAVDQGDTPPVSDGKSIEMLVTEALKPMLQQWLDANLPRLVEERLQEELKRRAE